MSNKSVYAFVFLLVLIIIGMLTGSFRFIIYPYMFIIGLLLISGLGKTLKVNKKMYWIPTSVTILFLLLMSWLDRATLQSTIGEGKLILGFTVSTAIYYLGIWTLCACISLLYAWTFNQQGGKQSNVDANTLDL